MISVCLASYNGEKYIRAQLVSILQQLSEVDEVIVSDDGSTDKTLDIIKSFNDSRIKIYQNVQVKRKYTFDYVTHNFETALMHCSGEYIFLSDQDDVWLPNKVSLFLNAMLECDLVLSDCLVVNELLKTLAPSYFDIVKTRSGIVKNIYQNSYLGCCMAFRRNILEKAFPFPNSGVAHDIWLGIIAKYYYRVSLVTTPTLLYRRHAKNISPSAGVSPFRITTRFYFRWKLIVTLIRKIILLR